MCSSDLFATVLYQYDVAPSMNEKSRRFRVVRLVKRDRPAHGVEQVDDVWTLSSRSAMVGRRATLESLTVESLDIE